MLAAVAGTLLRAAIAVAAAIVYVLVAAFVARLLVPRPLLLSLPYSHYVEIARWALDASEHTAYTELALPIGVHCFGFSAIRLMFPGGLSSSSSYPGANVSLPWYSPHRLKWLRRLTGTPAFITAQGNILPDSWSILKHAGFEIDTATQAEFDVVLGPAIRQFAYYHIFTGAAEYYRTVQSCSPVLMVLFDMFEYLLQIKQTMIKLMNLTEAGEPMAPSGVSSTVSQWLQVESVAQQNLCTIGRNI
jgi:hypothetical protein